MLAIAISFLFGLAAVAAITVVWQSLAQGVAGAQAIRAELSEMAERERAAVDYAARTRRSVSPAPRSPRKARPVFSPAHCAAA